MSLVRYAALFTLDRSNANAYIAIRQTVLFAFAHKTVTRRRTTERTKMMLLMMMVMVMVMVVMVMLLTMLTMMTTRTTRTTTMMMLRMRTMLMTIVL